MPQIDVCPDIWAKSPKPPTTTGESLESHTLQVLNCLNRLRARAPNLDELCEMPRLWRRASIAAVLHDLGKCCTGFQSTLKGGPRFRHRHEVLSVALIPWLYPDDRDNDVPWIAAAILTHHKDLELIGSLYPFDLDFDELEQLQAEATPDFFGIAEKIFRNRFLPTLAAEFSLEISILEGRWDPPEIARLIRPIMAAAFNLAEEIRTAGPASPRAIGGHVIRGLLLLSDHAGSAGETFRTLDQITNEMSMLKALDIESASLYPHQLDLIPGNCTLIAPTGSGKTEASLLWAARTGSQTPGSPVLFYVLPYQASINAMHERLSSRFGDRQVAMQHSRAAQAVYRQLLDRDYKPELATLLARKAQSLARLHAKPVRVLTPWQLLRGAYQLKGHEALWTDAARSLMILDEIHAYESERLGMILATVRHLAHNFGARMLFMSATMSARLLEFIHGILPNCKHVNANLATYERFRRHRINLVNADLTHEEISKRVSAEARAGKAILVVATTVGRAQHIYSRLKRELGDLVSLLHGRFHSEDRFEKERDLIRKRGPNGNQPAVLVATQVVEVSLNVDFDVLYSDPAPLEALVQRFGRVNRRRRVPLRDVFVMRNTPEGSPVYRDTHLRAAIEQLERFEGAALDEGTVQGMLDSVYGGEIGDVWIADLEKQMGDFQRNVLDALMPFRSSDELAKQFDDLFDGYQVLPKSLESEYERRLEEDELNAPALLIPITRGQFWSIKPSRRPDGTLVTDRPYSEEEGLNLTSKPHEDGI